LNLSSRGPHGATSQNVPVQLLKEILSLPLAGSGSDVRSMKANISKSRHNAFLIKISRAPDRKPRPVQDMRIDHGGGDICVSQEFLHRADIVTRLQEMRGKRVP